jgi:lysophospholipase L1-like esterase
VSLNYITLTGTMPGAGGAVLTAALSGWVADPADDLLIPPVPDPVTLANATVNGVACGTFTLPGLMANDNAGIPAGTYWVLTVKGISGVALWTQNVVLNHAAGASQDISALAAYVPAAPVTGTMPLPAGTAQPGQFPVVNEAATGTSWAFAQSCQALTPLSAALANRQFARCNIVALGDSITEGQHATVMDYRWLARLRDRLRSMFPVTGAGSQPGLPGDGQYLAQSQYAPSSQTLLTSTGTTYSALSSSNVNTGSFTAPPSGAVWVTVSCVITNVTAAGDVAGLALLDHGTSNMRGFASQGAMPSTTSPQPVTIPILVTGLTPGNPYDFDLASGAPSGTVTVYAYGQATTTPGANRGAPVTMTVQAVGVPGTGGRGFLGVATTGESSFTWPAVIAGSPAPGATLGPKSNFVNLATGAQTITYTLVGDSADIMWTQVAFGGTFSWQVDGGTVNTVSTNGSGTVDGKITHISLGTMGTHTLVLAWSSGATASMTGVTEYCGDYAAGIHVHDAGHFGWQTSSWVSTLASGAAGPAAAIAALNPAAVLICLGTNDQDVNVTPATYAANLQQIITYLKAELTAPYPAFVLVMLPPRTLQSTYTYPWAQYVAQAWAVAAADTSGPGGTSIVSVMDFTQGPRLPGADTDVYGIWQAADLVHPSNLGHQAFGDMLAGYLACA